MSAREIIIQALGACGILMSILSFQFKKHKPLMLLRTGNELLFGIQYMLLGAYTGMSMNFIGCVRNIIFTKMVEKKKSTVGMRIVLSVAFAVFSIITWAGYKSILIGAAKVISTFAYGSKNTSFVRVMILITSSTWLFYNAVVKSYTGCLCEILTLTSIIVGIIRLDIMKREQ